MSDGRTEMEKRDMLRLSNAESNKLTRECIQTALIHLMAYKELKKISISEIAKKPVFQEPHSTTTIHPRKTFCFLSAHSFLTI